MNGYFPENEIDHKDGDGRNNKWDNLREVSIVCNAQNCKIRSTNKSGFPGVSYSKYKKKWIAQATLNGKNKNLGLYANKIDAALARLTWELNCDQWRCNHRSELVRKIVLILFQYFLHNSTISKTRKWSSL